MSGILKKLKILGVFEVVAVKAFPSVEQVFTLFYWNEVSSSLQSETDESQYKRRGQMDRTISCNSKPKLVKFKNQSILFVEDDNKVTIYNSNTKLKVEVLPRHHGMSQINEVVLCSSTSALFLDYGKRTVLVCDFTLSHSSVLNWQIREIHRWDNVVEFDWMTWDDGKLVGFRSAEMFITYLRVN